MFGFALALAGISLLAFLIVLVLAMRFFGALEGGRASDHREADADIAAPHFKRF